MSDAFDPKALRNAFGAFPTGVTVVTARTSDGTPVGFTANSFTSVSLDPPLLLVCPAKRLNSYSVFEGCSHFAVNILAEGQEAVSNTFAGFQGDRFAIVDWHAGVNDVPILDGVAAHFACSTHGVHDAGDHAILMGRVEDFAQSDRRGLGYAGGQYFSLGLEREAAAAAIAGRRSFAGALIVRGDDILVTETPSGYDLPRIALTKPIPIRAAVTDWLFATDPEIKLGKAYSIFEDSGDHLTYFLAHTDSANVQALGRYVPISDLEETQFATPALASMLSRFAIEFRTQSFGLYVGDDTDGEVLPADKEQ